MECRWSDGRPGHVVECRLVAHGCGQVGHEGGQLAVNVGHEVSECHRPSVWIVYCSTPAWCSAIALHAHREWELILCGRKPVRSRRKSMAPCLSAVFILEARKGVPVACRGI
jgi:hypothetical protein